MGTVSDWEQYDTVYLGFPIWYYAAPNVVNTFCKAYDWSGKKIYLFATSGGSDIGKTADRLIPYMKGAEKVIDARVFRSTDELDAFIQ